MTRIERLTSSRDFRRVSSSGRRAVSPTVSVTVVASPGVARVGFAASTRIGSAVKRNRAKRLLRESVGRVELPTGLDVVVSARPAIVGKPLGVVANDLSAALKRLGIAC